ncbi:MAG: monooxygenase [Rhizobacter sp.]|nr:monooxygenase [Rhizobacter sp.]
MDETTKRLLLELAGGRDFDPDELKRKYMAERDGRVRPEGNSQYVSTKGLFKNFSRDPWVPPDFRREPVVGHTEVIVAGGGFGGLLAGARLHEAGCRDIRVIEIAGDFGGTWYWNRYPGAMCDIEAHIYMPMLEELAYAPKHRYAYAPEMLDVSQRIGHRYELYEKALFQTAITSARWDDERGRWCVETSLGDRLTCDVFVIACGRQSLPKLPGLPGVDKFEGHAFHTSRWDYDYTGGDFNGGLTGLADKRVAVIGTGATAVQVVPEVAKYAKELLVFQRTPTSTGVRGQRETPPDYVDLNQPGWQRARRYNFQSLISGIAQDRDLVHDGWTEFTAAIAPPKADVVAAKLGREPTKAELKYLAELYDYDVMNRLRDRVGTVVKNPSTAEALKPWYRWFCKRPGFHDDYLEAFNLPNVKLVDTGGRGVDRLTERGVVADGVEYGVDCLIFATGFEAGISFTHLTGFEIRGRDGVELSEHWRAGVRTLHGLTTDQFPNCFLMGGNQQSASAVNAVHLLDEQAQHIAYIYQTMRERHITRVEPSAEAVDAYVHVIRSSPANDALVDYYYDCTPGYYNMEGRAKRSEDIFFGGRYGAGPIPFFDMLAAWRKEGSMAGFVRGDAGRTDAAASRGFVNDIIS